jgi:hypothetical protein
MENYICIFLVFGEIVDSELLENGALHKAPQKAGLTCTAPILLATRADLDLKNDRMAGKFVKT